MPQLKKVVLAMGDRLIYRDTYDEALAELTGGQAPVAPTSTTLAARPTPAQGAGGNIFALAERIRRLRQQVEQLARELEALGKDAVKK
jgi:uncharacterized protein